MSLWKESQKILLNLQSSDFTFAQWIPVVETPSQSWMNPQERHLLNASLMPLAPPLTVFNISPSSLLLKVIVRTVMMLVVLVKTQSELNGHDSTSFILLSLGSPTILLNLDDFDSNEASSGTSRSPPSCWSRPTPSSPPSESAWQPSRWGPRHPSPSTSSSTQSPCSETGGCLFNQQLSLESRRSGNQRLRLSLGRPYWRGKIR